MKRERLLNYFIPSIIGFCCFILVMGFRPLDVTNINWLFKGDPYQSVLGWSFYRNAPWTFPLGLNLGYGIDYPVSLFFTDSFPLLSIFFKLFSKIFPDHFQFSGISLCIFFILQGIFSWKIIELYTNNKIILILSSILFIFTLPMLWRLYGHYTLVAHFYILCAIYLYLISTSNPHYIQWAILLACALLTHIYIFVMCAGFWLMNFIYIYIYIYIYKFKNIFKFIILELSVLIFLLLTGLITGLFIYNGANPTSDFGFYRMNAWSIVDSDGWSYIIKDLPSRDGEYEGFNFLGLGYLLILLCSIPAVIKNYVYVIHIIKKYYLLELLLIFYFIFALSNHISIGYYNFIIPLPQFIIKLCNNLRASGRFFWPINYCLLIFILVLMIKFYRQKIIYFIFSIAIFIQISDSSIVWTQFRNAHSNMKGEYLSILKDEFWQHVPITYSKIRKLPWTYWDSEFAAWGMYALKNGLQTDIVYYNRDFNKLNEKAQDDYEKKMRTGELENDTLYIVDKPTFDALKQKVKNPKTEFKIIDGFYVIAPNGLDIDDSRFVTPILNFSQTELPMEVKGLSQPGDNGRWSDGKEVSFVFPKPLPKEFDLNLFALAYGPNINKKFELLIGNQKYYFTLPGTFEHVSLHILNPKQSSSFAIVPPTPASPKDLGQGGDERKLGIFISNFQIIGKSEK